MRKRLNRETNNILFVSADSLAAALDCGRTTADRIGIEAGARVKIGGSVRYDLEKVKTYLRTLTEEQSNKK